MAAKKRSLTSEGGGKTKKTSGAGSMGSTNAGNGSPPTEATAVAPTAAPAAATTTITRAIQQVRPMAREAFEEGRGQSQQMVQDFESSIRQQPIRSLLMAAGVGFLIGLIWR